MGILAVRKLGHMCTAFAVTGGLLLSLASGASASTDEEGANSEGEVRLSFGNCTLTLDDPHWSSNGGSVVQKSRVHCPSSAEVRVEMQLHHISGGSAGSPVEGPGQVVMTETETRTIPAGQRLTFQVPPPGGAKVTQAGTYYGSTTATVVKNGASSSGKSNHKYVSPK